LDEVDGQDYEGFTMMVNDNQTQDYQLNRLLVIVESALENRRRSNGREGIQYHSFPRVLGRVSTNTDFLATSFEMISFSPEIISALGGVV
jgi:hypothetical protein